MTKQELLLSKASNLGDTALIAVHKQLLAQKLSLQVDLQVLLNSTTSIPEHVSYVDEIHNLIGRIDTVASKIETLENLLPDTPIETPKNESNSKDAN